MSLNDSQYISETKPADGTVVDVEWTAADVGNGHLSIFVPIPTPSTPPKNRLSKTPQKLPHAHVPIWLWL